MPHPAPQAKSQAVHVPPPREQVFCDAWEGMRAVSASGTSFAVLRRPVPPCPFAIQEVLMHPGGAAQVAFELGQDLDLIPASLDAELDLRAEDALVLLEDIRSLTQHFLEITKAGKIGVRLERVETDSCRLFHVDQVPLRLITTYFGKGTEWLRNSDVRRSGLGQGDDSLVLRPRARIEAMEAGWVGLMKGERGNDGNGLVHRSPRIEENGLERLLLRMDAL